MQSANGEPNLSGIPILVVEDEITARMVLVKMLRRLGMLRVELAMDGDEAMAATMRIHPALIFCDVHMRPKDGLTFVTELRFTAPPVVRNTPVVMVTAETRETARTVSKQLHISSYLVKPPKLASVRAAVEKALGVTL
jgi:two-component system chemotaxis response regulator CheY